MATNWSNISWVDGDWLSDLVSARVNVPRALFVVIIEPGRSTMQTRLVPAR
jgi:hypothetical protein